MPACGRPNKAIHIRISESDCTKFAANFVMLRQTLHLPHKVILLYCVYDNFATNRWLSLNINYYQPEVGDGGTIYNYAMLTKNRDARVSHRSEHGGDDHFERKYFVIRRHRSACDAVCSSVNFEDVYTHFKRLSGRESESSTESIFEVFQLVFGCITTYI